MTVDGWITVATLGLMFGLLIGTKLPPAVVFAGALTIAPISATAASSSSPATRFAFSTPHRVQRWMRRCSPLRSVQIAIGSIGERQRCARSPGWTST